MRELRRRLKSDPAADVQALRDKVKELELAAEEAAQRRLAVAASPPDPARGRAARREDALYNLDLQVGAAVGTQAIRRAVEALTKNS